MKTSLYQPEQQNAMRYIEYGALYYHVLQGIPLILWTYFIYVFYKTPGSISALFGKKIPISLFYILIMLPFIVYFYTIYQTFMAPKPIKKVKNESAAAMPHGWGYCFTSEVTSDDLNKGIIGFLDEDCIEKNLGVFRSRAEDMLNRYHYLNYILLLLIITFRWHTKYIHVRVDYKSHPHIIGFAVLFGVLTTILPLFSTYLIRGMWVVQTVSIMLTMNVVCFSLLILSFLKDFA